MIVVDATLHEVELTGTRFLRSIRVDADLHDDAALSGYVVTAQTRSVLERLVEGLEAGSADRAWTLTGPYGTGKSALALFASRLLSDESTHDNMAWRILREQHTALANELSTKLAEVRLLPLLITARRATFSACLTESVARLPQSVVENLSHRLDEVPQYSVGNGSEAEPKDLYGLKLIHDVSRAARRSGYAGVLLIVDELGKILENVARDPTYSDVFVLQDLAEAASRSGDAPLLVIGVLHQAFEQYARHLDAAMRREWAKVQGRYADIAFIEPPEQLIRLSSQAMQLAYGQGRQYAQSRVAAALPSLDAINLRPPMMTDADFNEIVLTTPAIHPVTLVALPYLFRRFAQNERSLFTYLVSQQPFGVYDQVHRRGRDVVRVPDLFDYAVANLSGGLHRHTIHQRWLEVVDALEQASDLSPLEVDVIKTIGVLSVLADGSHLRASEDMISFSLRDRAYAEDVVDSLKRLRERSMIVYRRFLDSYRVWEGSDVDIDARIDEARVRTAGQFSLASSLHRYLPFRPLVARRHSHEHGMLRYFQVQYLDDLPNTPITLTTSNGIIACCLPSSANEATAFEGWASSEDMVMSPSVLVALPWQISFLREATSELVALHWVQENTPSLRDDRIARRELRQRISEIEAVIAQQVDQVLDPRPAPLGSGCLWYWQGIEQKTSSLRNVTELLSTTMDALYSHSPRIQNELINRSSLSSAAAAARRTLIERMLTHAREKRLGIEGFPPERAIYESTLAGTSLHREDRGVWKFCAPEENDIAHNLRPAWNHLEDIVFGALDSPVRVDSLLAKLSSPPYGVSAGFFPVLLCAFLLARGDEVSLYRDDAYIPEPAVADFEILLLTCPRLLVQSF